MRWHSGCSKAFNHIEILNKPNDTHVMNDIAIIPPLASPSHPPHYRKAEVMVYGMTQAEEAEFRSCERVISRGAKDFYPVGRALARIQSARLYRVQYATFTDYCQDRWGFSRIRAYQLISASERYELLKGVDGIPLPKNESQLRALMKVPEQDIEQVWRDFISGHGKGDVRAKHVETFVKERYGNLPRRKRGRGKGGKQCENLSVHLGMVFEMANLIRELNIVVEDAAENEHVVDISRRLKDCADKLQQSHCED